MPVGAGDFTVADLENAMSRLGFRASRVRLRPSQIDPRLMPCLFPAGADQGAECPERPRVPWMRPDGAEGFEAVACDAAAGTLAPLGGRDEPGEAVVFVRIDGARLRSSAARRKISGHGWFRTVVSRFSPQARRLLAIGLVLNTLGLAAPLFILMICDRALGMGSVAPLVFLGKGLVIVLQAEFALRRVRSRLLGWVMARLDHLVGVAIFDRLVHLPAKVMEKAPISGQAARIESFESIRDVFCGPAALISLVAAPVAAIVISLAACFLIWRRIRVRIREAAVECSVMQQFTIDTFEKLGSIQADGPAEAWGRRFREISGREQRTVAASTPNGAAAFSNVALRDDAKGQPVIRELSIALEQGEVVAVTGPTGSGKSLAPGIETPPVGSVLIDGFDIRQLQPMDLRAQIAYSPRRPGRRAPGSCATWRAPRSMSNAASRPWRA